MEPLVSVICITRNHERFCIESLDSVLNQTYKNIEWIILDAASTDGTVELIDNWLVENNVQAVFLKEKELKSLPINLNKALTYTHGEYVQFMSLDDVLVQDKISIQVKLLQDNTNCVFTYSDSVYIDENNKVIQESRLTSLGIFSPPSGKIHDDLIRTGYFINAVSLLWNHNKIKILGKFNENYLFEDLFYVYHATLKFPVIFSKHKLIKYRVLADSLSHKINSIFDAQVAEVKIYFAKKSKVKGIKKINEEIERCLINIYKNSNFNYNYIFLNYFRYTPKLNNLLLLLFYFKRINYKKYQKVVKIWI